MQARQEATQVIKIRVASVFVTSTLVKYMQARQEATRVITIRVASVFVTFTLV
jgi:hypothetical protein